jgi:hypothetical protein
VALATGAWRAACVAQKSTVSLVEVSPSTVIELNERTVAADRSFCSTAGGSAASVNT